MIKHYVECDVKHYYAYMLMFTHRVCDSHGKSRLKSHTFVDVHASVTFSSNYSYTICTKYMDVDQG